MSPSKQVKNEDISRVMATLGARKSAAKTAASRANIAKANQANRKDPLDLPCTCTGGESLEASLHVTTCPRGRLLHQRERAAQKKASEAA